MTPPTSSRSTDRRLGTAILLAAGLLLVGAVRVATTWNELSPTADEPSHLGAGMQLLDQGIYDYERLHPPLARTATALGPFLDGRRGTGEDNPIDEGRSVLYGSDDPGLTLTLARAGILPFFLLGGLIVGWWTWRLYDRWTAAVAVGLFAHLPPVLAHGGLATTDMAGAATLVGAVAAFAAWLAAPTARRATVMGLATGLAVASKYSALPFLTITGLLVVSWRTTAVWPTWKPTELLKLWRQVLAALALAFLVLWGAHGFAVESMVGERTRPYRNVDSLVGSEGFVHDSTYRVVEAPLVPVAARSLRDGLVSAMAKNREGHTGFLLGEMDSDGWWSFFPVAIGVKTPLAFLLLAGLGVGLTTRDAWRRDWRRLVPLLGVVAVLAVSLPSRINIGLRHVLAIYPLLCVPAACAVLWLWRRGDGARVLGRSAAVLLVAWQVAVVSWAHPDYLPWFNPLASGAPERILNDSDLDWGQDLDRLAAELERRDVEHVWLAYFGSALPERHGLPPFEILPTGQPVEGWIAISLFQARGLYLRDGPSGPYAWLAEHRPVTRVGASIDLYRVGEP